MWGWRTPCAAVALPSAAPPHLLAGSGGPEAKSDGPAAGSGAPAAVELPSLAVAVGLPSSFGLAVGDPSSQAAGAPSSLAAGAPSSLLFGGLAATIGAPSSYLTATPPMAPTDWYAATAGALTPCASIALPAAAPAWDAPCTDAALTAAPLPHQRSLPCRRLGLHQCKTHHLRFGHRGSVGGTRRP
ncbi:hypothetical protein GUJ93_ZPchr0006g41213 [Zizania palustris]|uniref:Uncharacterized protein n=1 Tax=Zizania palustris TaxID=103762 RepID=A0A8J5SYK4_ZIZPA|nr:hypothetical protein GUJ93_ZPchr0006g41213 [Zizania palustris]